MSINNLSGGLNRFSAIIKHRPNTTLQFIVYKYISGGSYSIGELSQELDYFACAGVNHIISLDSFVNEPIVNGEEYFLVVNIQRPNCYSFNAIDFIGEADYINNCPPDTYQDSNGNCVPIIISPD